MGIIFSAKPHLAEELGSKVARVTRLKSPESATDIVGDHWTLKRRLCETLLPIFWQLSHLSTSSHDGFPRPGLGNHPLRSTYQKYAKFEEKDAKTS